MGDIDWAVHEAEARGALGLDASVTGAVGGVDGALVRAEITVLPGPAGGVERAFEVTVLPSGPRLRLTPAYVSMYDPLEMWRVPTPD